MNGMKEKLNGLNLSLINSISIGQKIFAVVLLLFFMLFVYHTFIKPDTRPASTETQATQVKVNKPVVKKTKAVKAPVRNDSNPTVQRIIDTLIKNTEKEASKNGFLIEVNVSNNLSNVVEKELEAYINNYVSTFNNFYLDTKALDTIKVLGAIPLRQIQ